MVELRTVFATHGGAARNGGTISAGELAQREFGSGLVGYPGADGTAPYDPAQYEVIGYVAMHRSGPRIPVIRAKHPADTRE